MKAIKMIHVIGVIFLFLLANPSSLYGQNTETISGTVTDAQSGETLPGVNILVKGTTIGTSTDENGNYELTAPSLQDTLVASYIGYQTQEIAINGRTQIDIEMQSQVFTGEEMIVVGYGTQQRRDLTGSVSSVNSEQFNRGVQGSVDQMLQSKSPGVNITQTSSEPGGGASVRIRGATSITASNSPLYVIDGQPIENVDAPGSPALSDPSQRNPLNALNPNDIESVEILKDASATAIYGSRGANGVILITTKEGSERGLQIDYNGSTSIQMPARKLDLLNAQEYMTVINELREDRGQQLVFTQQEIDNAGKGTDWQEEIFRRAPAQNHNISFSGGSESSQYYVSLNYFDQEGVVISSGTKRYTGRANVSHSTGKFNFDMKLATSFLEDDFVPNGVSINQLAGVINTSLELAPTMPVYDENGNYVQSQIQDLENPVALAKTTTDLSETNRTFGNVSAEYAFANNLSAEVKFGNDRQVSRRDTYISTQTKRGLRSGGSGTIQSLSSSNYLLQFTLNYDSQFSQNHSLNAVAGYTFQDFSRKGHTSSTEEFPTDQFKTDNLSAGTQSQNQVGSLRSSYTLLSYLGRVNYSWLDRYLLTTSFRVDGSSRFGEGNKYGYFPSVAVGWRISDEPFFDNISTLSNLKLRASYGITGNQAIGNYQSLVLLGIIDGGVIDGTRTTGISPVQLGNPDLKWETTAQYNVGVDYSLWGDRITGSVDYFLKKTSDLLLSLPIPSTSGFSSSLQNVGNTQNSGFEFMVNSNNLVGYFFWSTNFNLALLENEVTNLGVQVRDIISDNTIISEGNSLQAYYGYKVDGIFQSQQEIDEFAQPNASPGNIRFEDLNNDGQINSDDRTILGDPFPDVSLGVNNSFSYKGFGLDIFIEGKYGQELLNLTKRQTESPTQFRRNRMDYVLNRWTPENPTNKHPSFVDPERGATVTNSRIVEDASFIRLKNLNLSYNFPDLQMFRTLSVYVNAQNLFMITDYSGYDPDVSSLGDSNIRVDRNAYPRARIYTAGVNIGF